jgi:hypothetical protein
MLYKISFVLIWWLSRSGPIAEILSNWSRCLISWNLALEENGHPNIGSAPCAGVVTIDAQTKKPWQRPVLDFRSLRASQAARRPPLRLPDKSGKYIARGLRESGRNQCSGNREPGNGSPDPHSNDRQNGTADAPGRFSDDA